MSSISSSSKQNFSVHLINAVSQARLDKMPQIKVVDILDMKMDSVKASGPIVGTDKKGRSFIAFVAKRQEIMGYFILRVNKKKLKEKLWLWIYLSGEVNQFSIDYMNREKYQAIKDLFEGKFRLTRILQENQ